MTKKVIIALSIIATLTIGTILFLSNGQPTNNNSLGEEIKDIDAFFVIPDDEENLSKLIQFDEIKEEKNSSSKNIVIKIPTINLQNAQNIYQEVDKEELLAKLPHKKRIPPILGIEVIQNSIAQLAVGNVIKLPTIGQVEYEAEISKKITHKNGSISVTGNLVGDQNEQHAVILTEGKNTSYASISTPEGAFEIETINGVGYVYSVKDIENNYIDPSKEDILHPHNDKH